MHIVSIQGGSPRAAAALRDRSGQVGALVLRRVCGNKRTIGAEVVVVRSIARIAESLESSAWTPLYSWVDAACQRYGGVVPVASLISATLEAAIASVSEDVRDEIDPDDLRTMRAEVARLIGRPRLLRDVRHEAIEEIDVALDDLIARLDGRDPLTAEHSRAVSLWCSRLADRMALDKGHAVHLGRCGLIHDIGKMSTPPDVLNAPRALTESEMTIMRNHAADGGAMIVALPLLTKLTPAVRHHHERIDGRGYPDGLAGTTIAFEARIVCVADAFNAMIGQRPYRSPFPPAVALERLVAARGTQFDPDVVDAMIDVVTNPL